LLSCEREGTEKASNAGGMWVWPLFAVGGNGIDAD